MSERHGVHYNLGFGQRIFLTSAEWNTYRLRKPVRYIKRSHGKSCAVCGEPEAATNPLEHSHQISFEIGVICLGLTPDYVDSPRNIVSAHKKNCNKASELTIEAAMRKLRADGIKQLPPYLPTAIHRLWNELFGTSR
jgi:hypothetical protein